MLLKYDLMTKVIGPYTALVRTIILSLYGGLSVIMNKSAEMVIKVILVYLRVEKMNFLYFLKLNSLQILTIFVHYLKHNGIRWYISM